MRAMPHSIFYTVVEALKTEARGSETADMAADMNANRWKYFRWTPRTAWITFVYVAVVPSVLGYVGYVTEVSGLLSLSTLSTLQAVGGGVIGKRKGKRGRRRGKERC